MSGPHLTTTDDPMAQVPALTRWPALFGVLYNGAAAALTGSDTSLMLACAWAGVYVLLSQWLARINDRHAEREERYDRAVAAWAGNRPTGR